MSKEIEKITESDIAKRLSRRYPSPAWAFLSRVRRGTGYSTAITTADAIAMSLFPSRGFEIHGFEIKVSKNDWKKELSDPYKAEQIQSFCHRWWIVVPDKDIITLSEVPQNWGVIVAKKNGNSVLKDAPLLTPEIIDYPFLGAIFRNLTECYIHKDDFNEEVEKKRMDWERFDGRELQEIKKEILKFKEFEEVSGLRIVDYSDHHKKIAKVVKLVMDMDGDLRWKFENLHDYASKIVDALKGMEKEMKGLVKIKAPEKEIKQNP